MHLSEDFVCFTWVGHREFGELLCKCKEKLDPEEY